MTESAASENSVVAADPVVISVPPLEAITIVEYMMQGVADFMNESKFAPRMMGPTSVAVFFGGMETVVGFNATADPATSEMTVAATVGDMDPADRLAMAVTLQTFIEQISKSIEAAYEERFLDDPEIGDGLFARRAGERGLTPAETRAAAEEVAQEQMGILTPGGVTEIQRRLGFSSDGGGIDL